MGKIKEKISCFGCGFCKENPHGYICLHEDTEKSKEIYEKRTGKRIKKNCMWIGREPLERGLKHCPLKKENREVYERGKRMTEEECNELLRELYFVRGWLNSDREYCNFDNLVNAIDLQRIKLEKLVKEHFETIEAIQFIFGINADEVIKEFIEKKEVKDDENPIIST